MIKSLKLALNFNHQQQQQNKRNHARIKERNDVERMEKDSVTMSTFGLEFIQRNGIEKMERKKKVTSQIKSHLLFISMHRQYNARISITSSCLSQSSHPSIDLSIAILPSYNNDNCKVSHYFPLLFIIIVIIMSFTFFFLFFNKTTRELSFVIKCDHFSILLSFIVSCIA